MNTTSDFVLDIFLSTRHSVVVEREIVRSRVLVRPVEWAILCIIPAPHHVNLLFVLRFLKCKKAKVFCFTYPTIPIWIFLVSVPILLPQLASSSPSRVDGTDIDNDDDVVG